MEKLLQWSIAQQSGDKEAMEKIGQPDPKMLEQLFGAPDEPALMRQAISVVENPEASDDDKLVALENFEMLIENLDNANNIENMKLWPAVIAQLLNSNVEFQVLAASIVGIATQNNPDSQTAFLAKDNGLSKLVQLASDSATPTSLVLKCLFAMASLVRNFQPGTEQFVKLGGLDAIKLQGSDHRMLLRKLSLLSAVLSTGLDDEKRQHIHSDKLVEQLVNVLAKDGNVGCIDKALNILTQLNQLKFDFTPQEISQLAANLDTIEHMRDQLSHDDFDAARQVASS
ncbi:CIC11C00000001969 [Sungouiella intermedia]|uniref:Hsp70 nucleotide exchange factor FES1 n=1 Tax=Sungouiella intermedia TaxID=45354 RepID=A0A1L0GJF9_9ASCO|nr:CIC11C00000001969 [[Candida] intermedia]